jgi:hypothetical protein
MKTALQILMLVLVTAGGLAAFAAIAGVASPSAILSSDVALLVYAMAGTMLVGFNDDGRRRPIILRASAPRCC